MPASETARPSSAGLASADIRRIIFGLMMAMLLAALDQTIVATALPTIGRDLGDADHLPWVVTAYLLAATSAVPIYGKLADIHGRRVVLLSAITIFITGSVLCALSRTMPMLVASRLLQGAGGGGLLALSQTIAGDMLSPRERAGYQAYFAAAFTLASLAGPVLGGFFAEHLDWSLIFWINLPLGIAAFVMTSAPLKRLPRHERPQKLDVIGAVLLVAATSTLLLALSWSGGRFGWLSPETFGCFAASAALLAAFAWHVRRESNPIIPLDVLRNPVVLTATLAATLSVGLFLGLAIYVPILFESVRGLSASQSGLALLPLTVGTVAGTLISGRAMGWMVHYKRVPLAAMPIVVAVALALAAGAGTLPVSAISLGLALISTALGTLLPVSMVSIQNAVERHQLGSATATANLCRQLGGAIAVAVFGAIVFASGPGGAPAHTAALVTAFRIVFGLVALGGAAAFATLVAMEERPLAGPAQKTDRFTIGEQAVGD